MLALALDPSNCGRIRKKVKKYAKREARRDPHPRAPRARACTCNDAQPTTQQTTTPLDVLG